MPITSSHPRRVASPEGEQTVLPTPVSEIPFSTIQNITPCPFVDRSIYTSVKTDVSLLLASVYACLRADVDENNASMCIHVKELQNQAVLAPGDKLNPRVKPSGKTSVGELLMGPSKNNLAPKACRSSRGIGIFEPPCGNEKYTLSQFRKRT